MPSVITSNDKKKVFITGSGNIEVTQVSQPISQAQNIIPPNISQQASQQITVTTQSMPKPKITNMQQPSVSQPMKPNISTMPVSAPPPASTVANIIKPEDDPEFSWLYVCDWRGCQRYKIRF